MSRRFLISLALAAALVAPAIASADVAPGQPKGDWIFRLGVSQLNPTSSPGLKNPLQSPTGGPDLTADSDVSLTGTIAYMFTDHIGTELLLAYPFTHGVDAKFPGGDKQRIAHVEHPAADAEPAVVLPAGPQDQPVRRRGRELGDLHELGPEEGRARPASATPSSRPAIRSVATRRSARTSSCTTTGSPTWTCATSA